jgi:orotate phosphoribosyltransferase
MLDYQSDFIRFMLAAGALRFGDFTTKSGRKTPYFINTGAYRTGAHLEQLGAFYARAVVEAHGRDFDNLFGPAYKGIPLAVTTAIALAEQGHDVAYCFNRKEEKDHGEGGILVGHTPVDGDRVLIVEDITTAGTAIREVVPLLRATAEIELAGLVVSVDRRERGLDDDRSALQALAEQFDMPAFAIVTVHEIMELAGLGPELVSAMEVYLARHGVDR